MGNPEWFYFCVDGLKGVILCLMGNPEFFFFYWTIFVALRCAWWGILSDFIFVWMVLRAVSCAWWGIPVSDFMLFWMVLGALSCAWWGILESDFVLFWMVSGALSCVWWGIPVSNLNWFGWSYRRYLVWGGGSRWVSCHGGLKLVPCCICGNLSEGCCVSLVGLRGVVLDVRGNPVELFDREWCDSIVLQSWWVIWSAVVFIT